MGINEQIRRAKRVKFIIGRYKIIKASGKRKTNYVIINTEGEYKNHTHIGELIDAKNLVYTILDKQIPNDFHSLLSIYRLECCFESDYLIEIKNKLDELYPEWREKKKNAKYI